MRAVSCDWSRWTRADKVASASTNRSTGGAARAVASRIVVLSPDLGSGADQRGLQSGPHDAGVCAALTKSTREFDFLRLCNGAAPKSNSRILPRAHLACLAKLIANWLGRLR